jgi:transposase
VAGPPVAGINPRQARDFDRATGPWAKADRIDAAGRSETWEGSLRRGNSGPTRKRGPMCPGLHRLS